MAFISIDSGSKHLVNAWQVDRKGVAGLDDDNDVPIVIDHY
jgi:hypothetical protein